MSLLARTLRVLRGQGLQGICAKLYAKVVDHVVELRYGLDTLRDVPLTGLTIAAGNRQQGHHYEGSRWLALRGLFHALAQHPARSGTLVDLGSGKGKVLLAAVSCGMNSVRGVEFARELCQISRENWRRYAERTSSSATCETVEADVATYAICPEETLFFLFNPFEAAVLETVLANIRRSVQQHPRAVAIVVQHLSEPYRAAFAATGWRRQREVVAGGCCYTVYE